MQMHMHFPESGAEMVSAQFSTETSSNNTTFTWDIQQYTSTRVRVSSLAKSPATALTQALADRSKPELLRLLSGQDLASPKEQPSQPPNPPARPKHHDDLCAVCQRPFCHVRSHKQIEHNACHVCNRPACHLKSHTRYVQFLNSGQRPSKSQKPRRNWDGTLSIGPGYAKSYTLFAPVANSTFDHFIALPIDKASEPRLNRLFRDFFAFKAGSMTNPKRVLAFDLQYCSALIKAALSDPALSYSCLAQSAAYSTIHGRGLSKPDVGFLSVYVRATQVLQEQIQQQSSGKYSNETIMAAVNLMMSHGIGFGDQLALTAHWQGIRTLVTACGGIHNVAGQVAGLILWLDYWYTLYTNRRPLYVDQVMTRPVIQLDNPPNQIYGSYFEQAEMEEAFAPQLLGICLDSCRLIELLEDKVHDTSTTARWQYFMYKRDSMCTRNAIVHYQQHSRGTEAECISLTMNLFLLLTLRMVPWRMPLIIVCDQLRVALSNTDLANNWSEHVDMLTWILFILQAAAQQSHWDGKKWALYLLGTALQFRRGKAVHLWPLDWWELERENVQTFAWSNVFLDESFRKTLGELATQDDN